jgi:hypothetical protein
VGRQGITLVGPQIVYGRCRGPRGSVEKLRDVFAAHAAVGRADQLHPIGAGPNPGLNREQPGRIILEVLMSIEFYWQNDVFGDALVERWKFVKGRTIPDSETRAAG